jgi:putative endopeptidase
MIKIILIFLISLGGLLYGAELQTIDFSIMDTSIEPGDDFYGYANGKWLVENQIPADVQRWGFYDLAEKKTNDDLIAMMKEKTEDPLQNLISDFYYSGIINKSTYSAQLKIIEMISTKADLSRALAYFQLIGVNPLFEIHNPDYWELRGTHYVYLRQAITCITDYPDNEIAEQLAKAITPSKHKYNLYSLKKLNRSFPNIDWDKYFNVLQLPEKKAVIEHPAYFKLVSNLVEEYSIAQWQEFLRLILVNCAAKLDDTTDDREFFVMKNISSCLPDLTGHLYTKKYFSAETRLKVEMMISNLQKAFKIRINQKDWLSDKTKQKAVQKIDNFTFKIGEPKFDESEYAALTIDSHDFLQNIFNMRKFQTLSRLQKCGKEILKDEWTVAAHSTNAWYSINRNDITLPAANINQIFDPKNDEATNYALLGTHIAHEMTHSLDNLGRRYNPEGKPAKWWKRKELTHFNELAEILTNHYNGMIIIDTLSVNGKHTLGENIADLGGLNIAFDALRLATINDASNISNGFSPQQRFFIAFAQKWRDLLSDNLKRKYAKSYYHSPPEFRTNGNVYNLDAFYKAFDITNGTLYKEKSQRITIW